MLPSGTGVRKLVPWIAIALAAAGCRDALPPPQVAPTVELVITESPSPFREVEAGQVRALIRDDWHPRLAGEPDDARRGFVAAPRPESWNGDRPPMEGLAALWVDGTRVGVPSDYYYLAASGPALDMITHGPSCRATLRQVIVDHRPAFASGDPDSPGDFVAQGHGTCMVGHRPIRWAYFVAAPGYGPVREVGIPASTLYVVVAVVPDSRRAPAVLERLLRRTEFGGATVADMIAAARPRVFQVVGPV